MTGTIIFDPLIPWAALVAVATVALATVLLAGLRGLSGWGLRALAGAVIVAALSGPVYQEEDRTPLTDIVVMLEDRSASQALGTRSEQLDAAAEEMANRVQSRPNTELRRVTIPDGDGDAGTQLMTALTETLAEEPRARVAGIIALTDGQVHDIERTPDLPAPLHVLLTGQEDDWDRRLIVRNAPAFAIIGEPVTLTLRVEDTGAAPVGVTTAPLEISIDGEEPQRIDVPIGQDL